MEIFFPNLQINFKNVPSSLSFGNVTITFYGLLIAIAMLAALVVILVSQRRAKGNINDYMGMFLSGGIGALVGARLLYVTVNFSVFESDIMKMLQIRSGGLDPFGGLIAGLVVCMIYCGIRKIRFAYMIDPLVLGLTMFQAVSSLGQFFMRTGFGEYNDSIFAMQLPIDSVNGAEVSDLMRENLVETDGTSYISVTPLFLCELIGFLVIFLFLSVVYSSRIYYGAVFELYLALYGMLQAGLIFLKRYTIPEMYTYNGVVFMVSLICFGVFGIIFCIRSIMARKRSRLSLSRREPEEKEENKLEE